jgi:exopolysaccharide production protein ExoZ
MIAQKIGKPTPLVRQKFGSFSVLQAGRGVAALLVLFFHANNSIFGQAKYWTDKPLGSLIQFGHAGVDFFFVLSGFIILHAHWGDLNNLQRLPSFFWKRLRRIYPAYWVLLLILTAVFFIVPSFGDGHERDLSVIVSSFILVHVVDFNHDLLVVAWSLYHEMVFYGLFAVAIWNLRAGLVVLALWFIGSIVPLVLGSLPAAAHFYMSPMHLLFGMGMVAAWLVRRGRIPMPTVVASVGIILFLGAALEEDYVGFLSTGWRSLVFGLGSALAVSGLVELERSKGLKIPGPLRFLGDASYSVYLIHFMALSVLAKLWLAIVGRDVLPHAVTLIVLCTLALGAGLTYYWWVERPLLGWLSRKRVSGDRRVPESDHPKTVAPAVPPVS